MIKRASAKQKCVAANRGSVGHIGVCLVQLVKVQGLVTEFVFSCHNNFIVKVHNLNRFVIWRSLGSSLFLVQNVQSPKAVVATTLAVVSRDGRRERDFDLAAFTCKGRHDTVTEE